MEKLARLAWPSVLVLTACGGSAGTGEPAKPADAITAPGTGAPPYVLPSDLIIASRVYDPDYDVPPGFFVDERATTSASYTLHHVLDDNGRYEVCTDDFQLAAEWEEADNASRAVQGYYVGAYENERYFEFIRELEYKEDVGNVSSPTSPGFARVFKCANTDREGADRTALSGFAGTLNATPRTPDELRVFAEYFWQFSFFPVRHKKVLDSVGAVSNGSLTRVLLPAFAVNQGAGRCDRIEVAEWSFVMDANSGEILQEFNVIHRFEARVEAGSPVLCD
jgi:hypothetical protein